MNPTREQAFEKIASLVERFREHLEEYKRGAYNEHQTRVDYINPFFKALARLPIGEKRRSWIKWIANCPIANCQLCEVNSSTVNHAERRIDELVYELYGLTEEEVGIVEGR